MKHMFFKVFLVVFVLLLCGTALAQEEIQSIELDLFSRGGLPEIYPVQFMAEDDFDTYVYDQLMQQSASINLRSYEMTVDVLKVRLENLVNNNPKLFFVDNSFQVATNSSGIILRLIPVYLYTGEDLQNRIVAFETSIREIAAFADTASTDLGKLLLLNDYFCVNFAYDTTLSIFGPDQLLTGGTGVCQAYMLAFSAVLDELGIPNTHATSHSMVHTWNVLELDGRWYHLDVTWNDSGYPLSACHDSFLLSDAGMEAMNYYDWTSEAACFDTRYDSFFWRGIYTPIGVSGDCVYYLDPQVSNGIRTIHCWNMTTGETSDVHSFSIRAADNSISYYSGFEPICANEDRIFYASLGRLHSVTPDGKNTAFVYMVDGDVQQIWSCWLSGDIIFMLIGDSPASNIDIVYCTVNDLITLTSSPTLVKLVPGESLQLQAALSKETVNPITLAWNSTDAAVTVNANGMITAVEPGVALVKASYCEGAEAVTAVIVDGAETLKLPAAVKKIESEAFSGIAADMVELPENIQIIDSRAFADSENLKLIQLPNSLHTIAADAFENSNDVIFICSEGSYAQTYALQNNIRYIIAE